MTLLMVALITLVSTIVMLVRASPEFSWDEADYLASLDHTWRFLWSGTDYSRHNHGPMSIYLAKLGQEILPVWTGSLETRLRFFEALVGSLAVGLLYATLRHIFKTSRTAALAGSSLLLLSVIRLEETNIVGPHHVMLACTLAVAGLGYRWREKPTWLSGVALGAVFAFGALSMTYVAPVAVCWAVAVALTGKNWVGLSRTHVKVAWAAPVTLATSVILVLALWPPGVLQRAFLYDFRVYLHYAYHPAIVGDRIFEVTPRSAAVYWLTHLDAPVLLLCFSILLVALWKAFRGGRLSSKHAYLAIFVVFFLVTALAAHLAGARNLLQFIGVLTLAAGALFDEALGDRPRLTRPAAAAVICLAALNAVWLSRSASYTPSLATDGYEALVKDAENRLSENVKALVYGEPILKLYAQRSGASPGWDMSELPWTTRPDAPLSADVKYVLVPGFYDRMPADQPVRRDVEAHWKLVWKYDREHAWELRLYQRPDPAEVTSPPLRSVNTTGKSAAARRED